MAGPGLPVNVDTTYANSGTDASVQAHQQHHDTAHGIVNKLDTAIGTATSGQVLTWNGTVYTPATPSGGSTTPYSVSVDVGGWLLDVGPDTATMDSPDQELAVTSRFLPAGTYDAAALQIDAAGSSGAVFRVAVYSDNAGPATLLAQSAAVAATTTGVKTVVLAATFTVAAGGAMIWAGTVVQGAPTTKPRFVRVFRQGINSRWASVPTDFFQAAPDSYYTSGVSAAPPSTWSATGHLSSGTRLAFRRSA